MLRNLQNHPLRARNSSKKYFIGSIWPTTSCGNVRVLGQVDKERTHKREGGVYTYFRIIFSDETEIVVSSDSLRRGRIRNPNVATLCEVGYLGVGIYSPTENKKASKEYVVWRSMIERCYGNTSPNIQSLL